MDDPFLTRSEKQALRKKQRLLYDTSAWPMFGGPKGQSSVSAWFWVAFVGLIAGCLLFGLYVGLS